MRTRAFWLMTVATGLRIVALSAITVHYVPLMVWRGVTERHAAFLLGAQAFMSLPSHMLFGWLADRVDKTRLMAWCMVGSAAGILFLIYAGGGWEVWLFLSLFSAVESTFPVNWSTVGEFFGRKNFAKIRGTMGFVQTWGAVIGPVTAGALYDHTHSYSLLLKGLVGVLLVTAVLYTLVTPPKRTAETVG